MAIWSFTENGDITDGTKTIKFAELVKFSNGEVRDIDDNPVPISVANSVKIDGKSFAELVDACKVIIYDENDNRLN